MAAQSRTLGNISISASDGFSIQGRALIHIGIITRDRVTKDPGVISCLKRQVTLALNKAAQISSLYLLPDIPQCPDTMEERIRFVDNICDLIFLIFRVFPSFGIKKPGQRLLPWFLFGSLWVFPQPCIM